MSQFNRNPTKKIWIINHYTCPDGYGAHPRQHYIARVLSDYGYKVTVFSASSHHLLEHEFDVDGNYSRRQFDGIDYILVKTRPYAGNGRARFLNIFDFSFRLNKIFNGIENRPDIVWASSPQPLVIYNALKIKKQFGCKLIYEERDIWPLTLSELNNINKYHPLLLLFRYLQLKAYTNSDLIVTPLDNLGQFVEESGCNKSVHIIPQPLPELEETGATFDAEIPSDRKIIGYVGSLTKSNSVMNLVKAAKILKSSEEYYFLFVGDGEQYEEIASYCEQNKLSNVKLTGRVSKPQAIAAMMRCDILYRGNPAISLYTYGIAPIKVLEYLWCKKPVIDATNAQNHIVLQANAGLVIKPEDENALAEAICRLSNNPEQMAFFSKNGRNYVERNYTADKIRRLILDAVEYAQQDNADQT